MKTKTSTAFILRVERSKAGVEIPFDKIYLFRKQDQQQLPRIFRNAMVFPLTQKFVSQIEKVLEKPHTYEPFPYLRGREESLRRRVKKEDLHKDLQKIRKEFLALVPVLFTKYGNTKVGAKKKKMQGRKKEASFPAYLIARPTVANAVSKLKAALSSRAYFIIDGKEIRPICLMCPLHQNFLQGHCHIGEEDCYRFLARATPADMVQGIRLYKKLTAEIEEPVLDLQEKADAQLSQNAG